MLDVPSRPNHLKFQPDYSTLGHQHRREYYTNRAPRKNDPASTNIYNTVSNQSSLHGKEPSGIAAVKNIRLKAHLYLLNDWYYHHRRSPHFPADVV